MHTETSCFGLTIVLPRLLLLDAPASLSHLALPRHKCFLRRTLPTTKFKVRGLQASTSSSFDIFKLRGLQASTSSSFDTHFNVRHPLDKKGTQLSTNTLFINLSPFAEAILLPTWSYEFSRVDAAIVNQRLPSLSRYTFQSTSSFPLISYLFTLPF